MTLQTTEQQLSNVLLFTIDVRLVSGRKRVRPEDIQDAKGVKIDSDEVMTLGSKKVFSPAQLNAFERLKDSMHRECLKVGTQFLSGYAVPEAKADALATALAEVAKKGEAERDKLLANYSTLLDTYCKENPTWETSIRAHAYSEDYIRDRIRFGFNAIKVVAGRESGVIADSLKSQVGGLLGSLLGDIAEQAEELQSKSLQKKDKKNRKVLRPLMAARDKLLGFTFLDHRLQAVADLIQMVERKMPDSGAIEGADLALLWSITSVLCDPRKTLDMAEMFAVDADHALAMLAPSMGIAHATAAATPSAEPASAMTEGVGFAGLLSLDQTPAVALSAAASSAPVSEIETAPAGAASAPAVGGIDFFSIFPNQEVVQEESTSAPAVPALSVVPTGFDALMLA